MISYQEAWSFLDQLQFFKIKLGLDSMNRFLAETGEPHRKLDFIHVAGTNGKGSVAVTLLTLLARAGYRVGLYTSPHLSSVRERFRINDRYISEEEFARLTGEIKEVLAGGQITYFEFTTELALLWFARMNVDLAIMEVGMGGRLDATNVVSPLVSVITNVSMDHEAYLGHTLREVAGEKAGIVKEGIPVVSGVAADESLEVVAEQCRRRQAPLYLLSRDFSVIAGPDDHWGYQGIFRSEPLSGLRSSLAGGHQRANTALALAVLELLKEDFPVDDQTIRQGLLEVRWPGRLETFCLKFENDRLQLDAAQPVPCLPSSGKTLPGNVRRFILDGAHNPGGIVTLTGALQQDFRYDGLVLIWGSMADKDMAKTLLPMVPLAKRLIFTRVAGERSATPEQLRKLLPEEDARRAVLTATVADALQEAVKGSGPEDLICIAGSLYLIGAARKMLLGEVAGP
jgi:dihydrofolate synthase/folylpolyglutamate synthase